jgi:O-antigen ligase
MGVLLTFKRHFWVAAILIFLLIIYLGKKAELKRIIGWGVFSLVISAIGFFFVVSMAGSKGSDLLGSSTARLASLLDVGTYQDPNSSLRWRDFEYKYALPQIGAHPLLGLGLGARYRPFIPHRDNAVYDGRGFIHNGHVWIMVKTGLLGYVAMVCLIVIFVIRGLRSWRKLPTPYASALVLGFTLAYIGMLLGTIVEPMLIEWRWTALIAVTMGLNEAAIQLYSVPEKSVILAQL